MAVPRRTAVATAAAVALAALTLLGSALPASAHGPGRPSSPRTLLDAGLVGSLPSDPTLFGVSPGALPWVVEAGTARVWTDGRLRVRVDGLVVPTAPQNGTNPVPLLAASLFCNGMRVATTAAVPFSPGGDAEISATVTVPARCLAPAVLLNPRGVATAYIAASGSAG